MCILYIYICYGIIPMLIVVSLGLTSNEVIGTIIQHVLFDCGKPCVLEVETIVTSGCETCAI